jgi:propionate CoA-transferase
VIVFIGNWQANARFSLKDGNIIITKPGPPKFVQAVDEITFNAREALRLGKQVYYVTQVGIFRLVPDGLQLWIPAAGIDVQRDILKACPARIFVSQSRS